MRERARDAAIVVLRRELGRRLGDELAELPALPETTRARIRAVNRELGGNEHRVELRGRYLRRDLLAVEHVARKRRAIAVEEHDDQRGLANVEAFRLIQEDAIVLEHLVFPVHRSVARRDVTLAIAVSVIEKMLAGIGNQAAERKRRVVERHERSDRLAQRRYRDSLRGGRFRSGCIRRCRRRGGPGCIESKKESQCSHLSCHACECGTTATHAEHPQDGLAEPSDPLPRASVLRYAKSGAAGLSLDSRSAFALRLGFAVRSQSRQ